MTLATLLWLVVVLGVVTLLAILAGADPGYVLISRAPYEIEISVSLLLVLLLVLVICGYFLIRLLVRTTELPKDMRRWHRRQREEQAMRNTLRGFAYLIEGDWLAAEKTLARRLGHSKLPLLDCLGAAYAAQQQGDDVTRDRYLGLAARHDPKRSALVEMTRAGFLERAGRVDESRRMLEALHEQGVRNRTLQGLLAHLLQQAADWPALERLLVDVKRSGLISEDQWRAMQREVGVGRLLAAAQEPGGGSGAVWRQLSRKERNDPVYIAAYARVLIAEKRMNQAEQLLRRAIHRQWNTELVSLYGLVHSDRLDEQVRVAESWTVGQLRSPALLITLARLYIERREKDKAVALLIEATRLDEKLAMEVGLLLESLGERTNALHCYRRGLQYLHESGSVSSQSQQPLSLDSDVAGDSAEQQRLSIQGASSVSAANSNES